MQAKIADGVYLSQGNERKLEQFSKGRGNSNLSSVVLTKLYISRFLMQAKNQ